MDAHLHQKTEKAWEPWSTGAAPYYSHAPHPSRREIPVAIECRFGSLPEPDIPMLDTGATWSLVGGETARDLADELGPQLGVVQISTLSGLLTCSLRRIQVTFLADSGDDLDLDATCAVSYDWYGPNVIGYRGFLERIRLALDPGSQPDQERLYFGPTS